MGKGDKRTKKGKIFQGSFGNSRPGKRAKKVVEVPAAYFSLFSFNTYLVRRYIIPDRIYCFKYFFPILFLLS